MYWKPRKESECQAVFRDNRVRSELGKPLRFFHQIKVDENGVRLGPSMQSPSNTNEKPSWYKL